MGKKAAIQQLDDFVDRLLDQQGWEGIDGGSAIPDAPDDADQAINRVIPIENSRLRPLDATEKVEDVRAILPDKIVDYVKGGSRLPLVVAVPAGLGKTYAGVEAAQRLADQGKRVLWLSANHALFDDLKFHDNFQPERWWHWQSLDGQINDQPCCLYPLAQHKWSELGYKSFDLCLRLCGRGEDAYLRKCPYRQQKETATVYPIVFGMHQHLFTGLDAGKFDVCIVDESFISCIFQERVIPPNGLKMNAAVAISELLDEIAAIHIDLTYNPLWRSKTDVRGKELFDRIGVKLENAWAQIDIDEKLLKAPNVLNPSDVEGVPYWYLTDLHEAAEPELRAWENQEDIWAERVWIARDGLHIIKGVNVWKELPKSTIILDATANVDFYNHVFKRGVNVYRPNIERRGRVYQVAGRMYHKGGVKAKDGETTSMIEDAIRTIRTIQNERGYNSVGVICAQAAVKRMIEEFGKSSVMWFYKLRGRNDFSKADAVFVVGTPTPPEIAVTNIALALQPESSQSFYKLMPDGRREPILTFTNREFTFSSAGMRSLKTTFGDQYNGAERRAGFYQSEMLRAIQIQLRESELIQAIHRARPNVHDVDVWLLSSIPTSEPIDGVYNDPPVGPDAIYWRVWIRLYPWLMEMQEKGEAITYDALAIAAKVERNWAYKNRWLDAIAEYLPGWKVVALPAKTRPKMALACDPTPPPELPETDENKKICG